MNAKQETEKLLSNPEDWMYYDHNCSELLAATENLLKELEATERKLAEAEKVVEAAKMIRENTTYTGLNKDTYGIFKALSDYEASKGE